MRRRILCKKVTATILAAALTMTSALTGMISAPLQVDAASSYENANLLVNPDFEDSKAFSPAGGSHVGNWFSWQSSAKATGDAQSGNGFAKFTGGYSALEQDLDGSSLIPGMTYVYTVWAKLSGTTTTEHIIGVKNYGGAELKQQVKSTEWEKYEIEFVYLSGNPRVYGYVGTHGGVDMYIDNASVAAKSDVESVSIKNGELTVKFVDSYTGTPTADDLSANYTVAQGANTEKIVWTDAQWDPATKTAVLKFAEIPAIAVEQNVKVNLTYGGAAIVLDFTVAANGEAVVVAKLVSVDAENGKLTAVLDKAPTVNPVEDDFTFEYKIGDGDYKELVVDNFVYSAADKEIAAEFGAVRGSEAQDVTVKVTYQGVSKEDSFALEVSDANTYYVDSTKGSDANDGLSPEKAFASIDKLNTITFLPGDEILFKKGETFVGCFKPQGSGTEASPITISSYGDGDKRPVLQPGEDWQVSHIMSADAIHPGTLSGNNVTAKPYVNYVIQFYNVEFWEVSDLELCDPTPQVKNDFTATYCSGITIQAEDIGTLEHIYVDNMIIHGFHGPGTNLGKTSGGITMNVITNKEWDRSKSVPTQINDIRITNCEIYDVGRSGINFLTPWARRTSDKWQGSYGTGRTAYEWLPYEDFYLGNNYIHDVDGDGCIVDNCANAVVENNLVTRCVTRLHSSAKMAVGLFNWNSDDTYFQFNEVYDIQIGGTEAYNDGQGIEIDALNDRTWVQYNYVHDNHGGFMMFCTVGDYYRGYDYVVRYNISQNDYAHPRQGLIDIYTDNYDGEIYNNTLYLTDRVLKNNQIFLFANAYSPSPNNMKFYNNIFYYDGEPKAATNFFDQYVDWQSNIFYGFTNLPENDNPNAPNLNVDPMLADPGKGGTGTWKNGVLTYGNVDCYKLLENSPAINAGVPLEDNGERDYFGNKVTGIPDIGAYESGSVALKLLSLNDDIFVDDEEGTITVTDTAKVTAKTLFENLVYEEGVTVEAKREGVDLEGGIRLADGDVVTATYNGETLTYAVKVVEGEVKEQQAVPSEHLRATAGAEEASSANDVASNAIDGNSGTMWHTPWYDAVAPEDKYLTVEVVDGQEYKISGYVYTPRQSGTNGIITGYEIYVSDDNQTWKKVAEGTWEQNAADKTVLFDEVVTAKYIKLLATNSVGGHASAAEVKLIGEKVDTDLPTTPVVSVGNVTDSSVKIRWTVSEDASGISEYVLVKDGEEFATFDPDVTSYEIKGLKTDATYTFAVYAVDGVGKKSEEASVTVTVNGEIVRLYGSGRYETGYAVADALKEALGVEKFEAVVVATGKNFTDALAGSYLAVEKNAPILLTNGKDANVAQLHAYIAENVTPGGKVYILGGEGAVPATVDTIDGYEVERLFGDSRYDTNLEILKEAGVTGDSIIVATGKTFADSLSASAAKLPILLVKPNATLNDAQKEILAGMKNIYIVGGEGAVSAVTQAELATFGTVTRVFGESRYDTSVEVAKTFCKDVEKAVVASGKNFPDGLCGGPLAAAMNAPLVLTKDGGAVAAAAYVADKAIASGYVLGGDGALADTTVVEVFGLESADEIK